MGLWIGNPELGAAEKVIWQQLANRTQGGRAVGGRLSLTDTRLLFVPNHLDALTGGKRWEIPLSRVRAIGRQSPDGGLFSGGLRTRLRIETDTGTELFVIGKLDEVLAVLDAAVPS
ncbi:hypothetical protein ATM97_30745 [Nocardia sp. MH4]|jgi:hypothetical protein|uniref:hypothetical protein n=1 Tax=Nocardia TaxID=1817 RepID=UPI001C4EB122|nr:MULTISPECIES: hypothetical protein [Nocardia]MBW0275787.1 hypothetical protein [Nocardia sp. MH4]